MSGFEIVRARESELTFAKTYADKTGFEPASSRSNGFQGHPINHSRTYPFIKIS